MPRNNQLPRRLEKAREQFERWRSERKRGERIPGALWDLAVQLSGKYGPYRIAKTLRLDYAMLKRRVETSEGHPSEPSEGPAFVEVASGLPTSPSSGCVVEIESEAGAKMRFHFEATEAAVLASMAERFLRGKA